MKLIKGVVYTTGSARKDRLKYLGVSPLGTYVFEPLNNFSKKMWLRYPANHSFGWLAGMIGFSTKRDFVPVRRSARRK